MILHVAIQMDPPGVLNPQTDSTLLLAAEAQRRGHRLYHYQPSGLGWSRGGRIEARACALVMRDEPPAFLSGPEERIDLSAMDIVLMRQDPPFDMSYIAATHMLEHLPPHIAVFNGPAAVRNMPEKILALEFPALTPPTIITADVLQLRDFRAAYGDIVLKPIFGHGGRGVFHVGPDSDNFHALAEHMLTRYPEGIIAQKFIEDARAGDKRIILADGVPVGAIMRVPDAAPGSDFRANLRTGAKATPTELTERDREICAALAPLLQRQDLVFAGIDVIGGWLTEINVTSPTGLRELNRFYNSAPEKILWDAFERKWAERTDPQKRSAAIGLSV